MTLSLIIDRESLRPSKNKPRPYQARALVAVWRLFASGIQRVMLVSPTGSGKGPMIGWDARYALEQGQSVLILQNRAEIITQNVRHCHDAGIPLSWIGVIRSDDSRRNPGARVQVASVDTLRNWPGKRGMPSADRILIDEAHGAANPTHQKILAEYPNAKITGYTATPWRLDGKGLAEIFQDSVVAATVPELVSQGFLVPSRCYTHPQGPDLGDVAVAHGDFVQDQLSRVMRTSILLGNSVEHYRRFGGSRSMFGFTVDIEHAHELARVFNEAHIPSVVIHGSTPEDERKRGLDDLKRGRVQVVFNCQLFTQGVDVPEVKAIGLYRPTLSKALAWQMLGRGMRPCPDTGYADLVVLDHAGILPMHGHPMEPQDYSLTWTRPKKGGDPPVKTCPECGLTVPLGTLYCSCGYEWQKPRPQVMNGELVEHNARPPVILPDDAERQMIRSAIGKAQTQGANNPLTYACAILERQLRRPPRHELLGPIAAEMLAAPKQKREVKPVPEWLKANGRPLRTATIAREQGATAQPEQPPLDPEDTVEMKW